MFLFFKLCLAHLIGDFVLQFDYVYRLKTKGRIGHLIHVLTHFVAMVLLTIPYLHLPLIWFFITFITCIHYIEDRFKYEIQKKIKKTFFLFIWDQIVHFGCLATIFLFPFSRAEHSFSNPFLNEVYGNSFWTLTACLAIIVTYGGAYILYNLRLSYFPDDRTDPFISKLEMNHNFIERVFIAFLFLFAWGTPWIFLSPLIGLTRFYSPLLKNKTDFLLSFTFAALFGLLFRLWV